MDLSSGAVRKTLTQRSRISLTQRLLFSQDFSEEGPGKNKLKVRCLFVYGNLPQNVLLALSSVKHENIV